MKLNEAIDAVPDNAHELPEPEQLAKYWVVIVILLKALKNITGPKLDRIIDSFIDICGAAVYNQSKNMGGDA